MGAHHKMLQTIQQQWWYTCHVGTGCQEICFSAFSSILWSRNLYRPEKFSTILKNRYSQLRLNWNDQPIRQTINKPFKAAFQYYAKFHVHVTKLLSMSYGLEEYERILFKFTIGNPSGTQISFNHKHSSHSKSCPAYIEEQHIETTTWAFSFIEVFVSISRRITNHKIIYQFKWEYWT